MGQSCTNYRRGSLKEGAVYSDCFDGGGGKPVVIDLDCTGAAIDQLETSTAKFDVDNDG